MFKNKNNKGANTMKANKKEFHFFKNEQSEKNHLIKKIDLLFYDLQNIETQSQILISILSEASLRTLNNVSEDLENAISKQIKEVK